MSHIEVSARSGKHIRMAFSILAGDVIRWRKLGTVKVIGDHTMPLLVGPHANKEEMPIVCLQDVPDSPEYSHLFKIMVVGAPRVGKTAIRYRYFCSFVMIYKRYWLIILSTFYSPNEL